MNPSFLDDFSKAHLLVAGEIGIDEYIWGDTRRISPEAPVPVVEVDSTDYKLGLSANVAQNIVSLGGRVTLVSVRGQDRDGERVTAMLKEQGIANSILVDDDSRPTLRKVRVIAQKQHVVRIDYESTHILGEKIAKRFRESVCDLIPQSDGIIVQDYAKGIWNESTMGFIRQAQQHKKKVFVDPSRLGHASLYRGATLLTPNLFEAETLAGFPHLSSKQTGRDENRLLQLGQKILHDALSEHVVVTCGEWGMVSVSKGQSGLTHIPTFAREVFDVTGAGDTVIAVLALMSVSGHSLSLGMQVANAAAGIVVGQIGAASVTPSELREEWERLKRSGLITG